MIADMEKRKKKAAKVEKEEIAKDGSDGKSKTGKGWINSASFSNNCNSKTLEVTLRRQTFRHFVSKTVSVNFDILPGLFFMPS